MTSISELLRAPSRRHSAAVSPGSRGTLSCVPWRSIAHETGDWDALASHAVEPNPFLESWFLLPALRAFDTAGDVRLIRFELEGRLAGLLPLIRRKRYYRWPIPHVSSWLHDNCFLGAPLVAAGAEHGFWHALFDWADGLNGSGLFLHLGQIPLEGPLYEAMKDVLAAQSRSAALVQRTQRAKLASALSPEAYLEGALSGKKRKELRRQFARLAELGVLRFDRHGDALGVDRWIEQFLMLEASGWKGQSGSALSCDRATAALFRESLRGAAIHRRLERLTLSLDGRPIAMLASFLTPPGAFSFKTAFDESFARFSPGVLLQRENLALLERQDIAWADSCAAADHPMIDHIWRERRTIGSFSIAIGSLLKRDVFRQLARAEVARAFRGEKA